MRGFDSRPRLHFPPAALRYRSRFSDYQKSPFSEGVLFPLQPWHHFKGSELPTWTSQEIVDELSRLQENDKQEMERIVAELASKASSGRATISEKDFGYHWPFRVGQGTLRNEPFGPGNLITFETSEGTVYAINGTARTEAQRRGWDDATDLSSPDLGTYESFSFLIELGMRIRLPWPVHRKLLELAENRRAKGLL